MSQTDELNPSESSDVEKEAPATQKRLILGDREILLVGTAHVSEASMREVEEAIETERPDNVAIELDDKRLEALENPEAWRKTDIVQVLKKKQGFLMLANIVLSGYQKRMGAGAGVKPGSEMVAAINKAKELGISQTMVDRPIAVTLRRAWAVNSLWGKCKLLSTMIVSAFSKEETDPSEIEKLKQRSEMDSMMDELSDFMPKVKQVLIDERDRYLASHIWSAGGKKVLAVLGAGHLPGVESHLKKLAAGEESSDCSDIETVPPRSLGVKIAAWVLPVLIVAAIVLGFVFGGKEIGIGMVRRWILCNAIFAGIFTILAGGHPLTILVAAAVSPISSLYPLIGAGIIAGIVQGLVCKPKVADMENMQQDALSLKGFYSNRILRVLLVFLLANLGSSIGAITAGASFIVKIKALIAKIMSLFGR